MLAVLVAGGALLALRAARGPVPVALVDPADPAVVLDREITRTFGLARPVVWILEPTAGTIWTPAMLARLQAMTREVLRIPGVVAPDVVSIASPNVRALEVSETGMQPIYLMGRVPETPEAMVALRARVDGDPMLRGQLVRLDGRAAMIVANFRDDADPEEIARAALALRDRYRDADAAVWVVGEPVLAHVVAAATPSLIVRRVLPIAAALLVLLMLALGWRATAAAVAGALVAAVASLGLAAGAGVLLLPWTATAALGAALVAAALAAAARVDRRAAASATLGAAAACGVAAVLAPGVERALASGALLALPVGLVAGLLARAAVAVPDRAATGRLRRRGRIVVAAALALVLAAGATRLRPGFALASYGQRWVPTAVAPDLAALARLFPPPQSLALRARGASGFVASPDVLHALDHVTATAARDPAVRSATSLADLVKIVNRAFNEGRPDMAVVPDDRGLIARYLALAYSPGFRRYVDRSLASTAVWIMVGASAPADLRRVEGRVNEALAAVPVPDAAVDRFGGDGAVTLAMAASGRRIAAGAAGVLLLAVLGVAVGAGRPAALRAAGAAALSLVAVAGVLGWCGQALDLLTLPLLAAAALAAVVAGGRAAAPARAPAAPLSAAACARGR